MTNPQFLRDDRVLTAIETIWHEAALLDRKDYPAWEKLFTEDGMYIVPIDPETEEFASSLNMVYDDARMRRLRVERMMQGYSPSAVAAATTVRVINRFELISVTDDEVKIKCAQVLTAFKRADTRVLGADITYTIALNGETPQIREKVARLINSEDAVNAAGFLI